MIYQDRVNTGIQETEYVNNIACKVFVPFVQFLEITQNSDQRIQSLRCFDLPAFFVFFQQQLYLQFDYTNKRTYVEGTLILPTGPLAYKVVNDYAAVIPHTVCLLMCVCVCSSVCLHMIVCSFAQSVCVCVTVCLSFGMFVIVCPSVCLIFTLKTQTKLIYVYMITMLTLTVFTELQNVTYSFTNGACYTMGPPSFPLQDPCQLCKYEPKCASISSL